MSCAEVATGGHVYSIGRAVRRRLAAGVPRRTQKFGDGEYLFAPGITALAALADATEGGL
jgi:hypothetical protein